MKKLLLSVAALGCFVSAQAQNWVNSTAADGLPATFFGTAKPLNALSARVGIGTGDLRVSPVTTLDLGNNFSEPGTFPNKISLYWQADNNYYGFGVSPGNVDYFTAANHRFFSFDAGGIRREVFNIQQSGNVGIGTSNPGTYRLAVEGKIGAREVVVTTAPWADYVFADSYKLRPLSEVARFIQENKHLPEVPTAAEIEKNGNSLAETDALLLKKIEELTLYVIEQNKQLQELKTENQALKKAINKK